MSSKKLKKRVSKELDRETDPAKKKELLLRHVRRRDLVKALARNDRQKALANLVDTGEKLHERRGNFLMGSFLMVITALVAWSTLADGALEPAAAAACAPLSIASMPIPLRCQRGQAEQLCRRNDAVTPAVWQASQRSSVNGRTLRSCASALD